jgi:magnesium chelatase family protein
MSQFCETDAAGNRLLQQAVVRLVLSARAYDRVRKVARTIADIASEPHIRVEHIAEALQFRAM